MHPELHQSLVRAGALASTEGAEHRGRRAGREAVHASGTLSSEAQGLLPFDRLEIFWSAPFQTHADDCSVRAPHRNWSAPRSKTGTILPVGTRRCFRAWASLYAKISCTCGEGLLSPPTRLRFLRFLGFSAAFVDPGKASKTW